MNILYIAISCAPYMGSEDKIGWNVPLQSAKDNKVFVITLEKQRESIENFLRENEVNNIQFYYVDIPEIHKKIYKGFFLSGRLNVWYRKVLPLAREICEREKIQVIHQVTPVEFRSIGDYGAISGTKFVCGPLAGGQKVPKELMGYTGPYRIVEWLRNITNEYFRLMYRISNKVKQCDYMWFANYETKEYLKKCRSLDQKYEILPDVSISREDLVEEIDQTIQHSSLCRFLVVGRLVHLKGHDLLLDAFERIPDEFDFCCQIVGDGVRQLHLQEKCIQRGLGERVSFKGAVPHPKMCEIYQSADVLILPSFREATGSVLLEAMANGLPVVTINKYGGAIILDNETGWLYEGSSKEEYIENLKNILLYCIQNPDEVKRKGLNARRRAEEFTWEKKMENFQRVYNSLVINNTESCDVYNVDCS